mgnify:FL=1
MISYGCLCLSQKAASLVVVAVLMSLAKSGNVAPENDEVFDVS